MTLPSSDDLGGLLCLGMIGILFAYSLMPILEAFKDWMVEIIQAARGTK